jgi:hypothetical protein
MARKNEARDRMRFEKFFRNVSEAVGNNLIPEADSRYELGSYERRWANVYTGDLHLKNDRGDWTILEEADFLCVINNMTGKKYKMVLEPLPEGYGESEGGEDLVADEGELSSEVKK